MSDFDTLTPSEQYVFDDSSSSDEEDDDDVLHLVLLLVVKEVERGPKRKRRGWTVGRLCIS